LDRDGVIITETNYLRHVDQMHVLRGAPSAIARLRRAGFKTVMVSNQSAVARGYVTKSGLEAIHAELKRRLLKGGARLDALYYCPHHPQAGRKVRCSCRKPKTGMIEAAVRRFNIDLKRSFMVGDSTSDVKTARNAGCGAVLVRTGKGGRDGRYKAVPDRICRDLPAAANWICKQL